MKRTLLFIIPFILFAFAAADLKPVDTDGAVTFKIKNFGINTSGEFKGLQGNIKWDAANPNKASFNVSIDVNSINTGIESRDTHLKKEDYFDAAKYPAIRFVSTAVAEGTIAGNLTIKGVTQKISFPFTITPSGKGYLFEGSFSLNRKDFGIGGGSVSLSDNVTVALKVQANP
ncbi:MAG: YceI family protein [Panacibacter sp.]